MSANQPAELLNKQKTQPKIPSLLESIGNTPLVELRRIRPQHGARILAKLEGHNPGGSVKDRPALWMIKKSGRGRPSGAGKDYSGAHIGKHRNRSRHGRRQYGLPRQIDPARMCEHGTAADAAGVWRGTGPYPRP